MADSRLVFRAYGWKLALADTAAVGTRFQAEPGMTGTVQFSTPLGDDLVQRIADEAAGPGSAQLGNHLSLLAFVEDDLQRNP